ncbi:MAG: AraC family transcriptional regulator [Clostridia bacterium]|jgi:predicted transcriptional regulator YdeE|nr:AraC family transcriptional regulator [Clostridia bacterium]
MKFEIVELEEKLVEGLQIRTTEEYGEATQQIVNVWQKFLGEGIYDKIENKKNSKTIGLYTDYEGDYTKPYNFIACTEVNKKSENIEDRVVKVIPKGKYAKFVIFAVDGDISKSLEEAWEKIWSMNLNIKYTCNFEEYQDNSEDTQNEEIHLYVEIEG